ncbi:glycosyltransferase [Vibrio parahaemolyticus]|uniref:glycosyltransferase n=1 Tax=Vibrio parahaemolyticus TaxID=670 RepID=UPI0021522A5A|nr:glycosyltransferase [Vibrio parahaemolyticus]
MSKRLIHHGHNVTMVCGTYGGGETGLESEFIGGKREGVVDGIRIIEFDLAYSNSDGFLKRSMTFVKFALKSIGLAFTEKYDVLFATTTPLTAGIPGIFARWLRGKPFVFEVRDLWPELPKEMGVIKKPYHFGFDVSIRMGVLSKCESLYWPFSWHCRGNQEAWSAYRQNSDGTQWL